MPRANRHPGRTEIQANPQRCRAPKGLRDLLMVGLLTLVWGGACDRPQPSPPSAPSPQQAVAPPSEGTAAATAQVPDRAVSTPEPTELEPPPPPDVEQLLEAEPLDLSAAHLDPSLGALVVDRADGYRIVLSLDPDLQAHLTSVVQRYDEPAEALVALDPRTGRVLAWVEDHNDVSPTDHPLLSAEPYAASVFKVISASALVEDANLGFSRTMCVPPGRGELEEIDLVSDANRDTRCLDVVEAMAQSVNVFFARLAIDHLSAETMSSWLDRFGFNQPIPFELDVDPSVATVPESHLERARMAAGFRHVHLSPLHGALIAAAVANHGVMMRPTLVARVLDAEGAVVDEHLPTPWRQVMSEATAQTMTQVLSQTTVSGTASRYFAGREGWPADLTVAGKTGTLSNRSSDGPDPEPFLIYSWFIGFAPVDSPEVAVAGLVYNTERWYIKGSYLASEAVIRLLQNN